jgi:tRNA (guanine-N7-)-methyltransferase
LHEFRRVIPDSSIQSLSSRTYSGRTENTNLPLQVCRLISRHIQAVTRLDTIDLCGLSRARKIKVSAGDEENSIRQGADWRPVRSYVLRGGRLTEGQKRALEELWPRYGIDDDDSVLDLEELFGSPAPVIMEIGFGNGDATWQMASAYPQENFLGVEVHRPGVGRLLLNIEKHGVENIRIACADAMDFLRCRIAPESLAGVRIYFPDPWPKKRHHKRRIIQPGFVHLLHSRMRDGALLHLATDWEPYAEHMLEVIESGDGFVNLAGKGNYQPRPDWRPETKYEKRGERLGHKVRDLLFAREN